jgi:CMP-N-acetylneuraminic acid synthetase
MPRSFCYIQARGGSKRFPRKNITEWDGVPMVADAIMKAQGTGLFQMIAVSSDNMEILSIAHRYGAMPLWRSAAASSDSATDDDVAAEVMGYLKHAKLDYVCKLYPCVPLLKPGDIMGIMFRLYEGKHEGVYAVGPDGKDAGACYAFKPSAYYHDNRLSSLMWTPYVLQVAQDINTPEDLELARLKALA